MREASIQSECFPARDVEPIEFKAEDESEEGADDKGGQADADHGDGHEGVVDTGIAMGGGIDAEGDADEKGDEQSGKADGSGDGPALSDDFVDGETLVSEGRAEVPLDEVAHVLDILNDEGFIEAVVGFHFGDEMLGDGFLVEEGAAGGEADQEEGNGDDAEEGEERLSEAGENVASGGHFLKRS